ncbi:MAG: hypothetical protein US18_C0014G0008 [Parcubacteria group bacterium GW2011_GWB1_36_5]|nr:MAG: hypothetical protein US12_C0014G0008 [Parcubacteria group bacterium GW2011_GWA2_36_24]KKQ07516.1 MAG: hypothetical protein US18_C0014G0008 [Parcubacteria group bacterium GW2011_GWB1_36_5]
MKIKQVIVWILIVVGGFGLLWLTGRNKASNINPQNEINNKGNQSTNSGNQLTESETFYNFGTISMKNGNVSKMFKVTNKTDKDILYPNLTTSCMCTAAYFIRPDGSKAGPFSMVGMGFVPKLNETIKVGESADIEVVYDPNAHGPAGVGMIDRFVELVDENGHKLQFEIKANVTP